MSRTHLSHQLRSLSLVAIAGAAACADPTDPFGPTDLSELEQVASALGGRDAVSAVTNERIVAHGDRYFPGQGAAYTEPRHLSTFSYVRTAALDADRFHVDHDHSHDYLYDDRYRFTEVVDGTAGFTAGHDAAYPSPPESAMFSSRVTSELQHARLTSPLRLVREALADPSRVSELGPREVDGRIYTVLALAGPGAQPIELLIDPATHLPAGAQRWEDNPPLGDTLIEARFDDYRQVDGLQLPHRVDLRADGLQLHLEQRTSIALNVAAGPETYAIPAAFQPPAAPYEPRLGALGDRSFELMLSIKYLALPMFHFDQAGTPVVMNQLAPGVMHVIGMTHHSLLIEMRDHLVLVDTPTPFPGWSRSVLDEIEERYPGKPIRYVVVSHFHNDHSGGFRQFVARGGVTALVGAASAPYFERVLANPHTLASDPLAERPVPVTIKPVEAPAVLADGDREVEVHRVPTTHANDMLIVYLPGDKLLFTADLFNPNFFGPSNGMPLPNPKFVTMARELYDELLRLGLQVETIAGAHGQGTATFEELRIAAGR